METVLLLPAPHSEFKSDCLYTWLGLYPGASYQELDKAWRRASQRLHPDRIGESATFQKARWAYEILSNKVTRDLYDLYKATITPDELEARAAKMLQGKVEQIVTELMDQDVAPSFDMVKHIVKTIRNEAKQASNASVHMTKQLKRLQKNVSRIKRKGGRVSVFDIVAQARSESVKSQRKEAAIAAAVLERVAVLVLEYECKVELEYTPPTRTTSTWTSVL